MRKPIYVYVEHLSVYCVASGVGSIKLEKSATETLSPASASLWRDNGSYGIFGIICVLQK